MKRQNITSALILILGLLVAAFPVSAGVHVYGGIGQSYPNSNMGPGTRTGHAYRIGFGVDLGRTVELIGEGADYELGTDLPNGVPTTIDAYCANLVLCFHPGRRPENPNRLDYTLGVMFGSSWIAGYKTWVGEPTEFFGSTSARATIVGFAIGLQLRHMFLDVRYLHGSARDRDIDFIPVVFGFYL